MEATFSVAAGEVKARAGIDSKFDALMVRIRGPWYPIQALLLERLSNIALFLLVHFSICLLEVFSIRVIPKHSFSRSYYYFLGGADGVRWCSNNVTLSIYLFAYP